MTTGEILLKLDEFQMRRMGAYPSPDWLEFRAAITALIAERDAAVNWMNAWGEANQSDLNDADSIEDIKRDIGKCVMELGEACSDHRAMARLLQMLAAAEARAEKAEADTKIVDWLEKLFKANGRTWPLTIQTIPDEAGICASNKYRGREPGDFTARTLREAASAAIAAQENRCLITGNMIGTDTRPAVNGEKIHCSCVNCQRAAQEKGR